MSDGSVLRLREVALDAIASEADRTVAIEALAKLRSPDAVEALLALGERPSEPDAILRAAGRALASLTEDGLVSQWDVRDLADPADDAFYE